MANVEAVLDLILARLDRFQATNDNLVSRIEKIENEKPKTPTPESVSTQKPTQSSNPEDNWNQHSNTPFHRPLGGLIGPRTERRQSSLFQLTEDELPVNPSSSITMSIQAYVVKEDEKVKFTTLSAILYGMERYTQYLKTQPEAKILHTRKSMAEFCTKDVLESIYLSEKSRSTELSEMLSHSHDLIGIPNPHLLNAAARLLRPKGKTELWDVLSYTVSKMRLPKLDEMRDANNEYSIRVEGYDKLLFKPMDQLTRTVCDAATFLYQGATVEDLARLPLLTWGKEKEPELFLQLVSLFEPYTKSIIKALGGMTLLTQTVKGLEELRIALNSFNALQAKRAKALSDTNAEFAPVKSISELTSMAAYRELRKKRQDEQSAVKSMEDETLAVLESNYASPAGRHVQADTSALDTSADFEYADTYSPPPDFNEGNLMLTKYQPPPPARDFCKGYFWNGRCEAGDSCLYKAGHNHVAVLSALEQRVRSMAKSATIGLDVLSDMVKKVKDNPQISSPPPPTPSNPKSNLPPPRTPLNQSRFMGGAAGGGAGNRQLYDPSRAGHAGARPTVRLLAGEVDSVDATSAEGVVPAALTDMD